MDPFDQSKVFEFLCSKIRSYQTSYDDKTGNPKRSIVMAFDDISDMVNGIAEVLKK